MEEVNETGQNNLEEPLIFPREEIDSKVAELAHLSPKELAQVVLKLEVQNADLQQRLDSERHKNVEKTNLAPAQYSELEKYLSVGDLQLINFLRKHEPDFAAIEDSVLGEFGSDPLNVNAAVAALERYKANYDTSLTFSRNRAAFRQSGEVAIQESLNQNQKIGVIGLDLDGLKDANTNYSKSAGDLLVLSLAHAIKDVAPDLLNARWSGDEFVILVSNMEPEQIKQLINNVRDRHNEYIKSNFPDYEEDFGFSAAYYNAIEGETLDTLVDKVFSKVDDAKDEKKTRLKAEGIEVARAGHVPDFVEGLDNG